MGLIDKLLAVVAMLSALRPLLRGAAGGGGEVSWRRALVLLAGGAGSAVATVGLLALKAHLFGRPFFLPTALGTTLSVFGGMLGVATILSGRAPRGLTEDAALRTATQALAMTIYVADPRLALAGLGLTRLARSALPWTVARMRWAGVLEGVVLLALVFVPRDPTLGGLRFLSDGFASG